MQSALATWVRGRWREVAEARATRPFGEIDAQRGRSPGFESFRRPPKLPLIAIVRPRRPRHRLHRQKRFPDPYIPLQKWQYTLKFFGLSAALRPTKRR